MLLDACVAQVNAPVGGGTDKQPVLLSVLTLIERLDCSYCVGAIYGTQSQRDR